MLTYSVLTYDSGAPQIGWREVASVAQTPLNLLRQTVLKGTIQGAQKEGAQGFIWAALRNNYSGVFEVWALLGNELVRYQ